MASYKFASAEVTFHVHATEHEERILRAVSRHLSLGEGLFTRQKTEGHFKTPISRYIARLTGEEASRFAESLFTKVGEAERSLIRMELSKHVDEHGALYLRLDKQRLIKGEAELSSRDAVKIRLKPAKPRPRDPLPWYESLLSG